MSQPRLDAGTWSSLQSHPTLVIPLQYPDLSLNTSHNGELSTSQGMSHSVSASFLHVEFNNHRL